MNNYTAALPIKFPYKNFSDRVDYQITDKLRASGRFSLFKTPVTSSNPTGSDYFVSDRGSERNATSITGDVTYTLSARTVINVRGEYHSFIDASKYATSFASVDGWAKIFPNTNFYKDGLRGPLRAGSTPAHVDHRNGWMHAQFQHGSRRRLLASKAHREQF